MHLPWGMPWIARRIRMGLRIEPMQRIKMGAFQIDADWYRGMTFRVPEYHSGLHATI